MKITSIEIFRIKADWTSAVNRLSPVIIRINTDEGISGLGEVGLAFGVGADAGVGYVRNIAQAFLIGADPMKIEGVWETLFRKTFWALGGGPVIYGGLSAVDIACWDIKGKALKQPVYQLLGGKTNEKLRTYASQLQFGWDPVNPVPAKTPEEYAEEARKAVAQGYNAVKVNPLMFDEKGLRGYDTLKILPYEKVKLIYNRIKAIREAVGPAVDIILETHALLTGTTAIQVGRALEEFNLMYYEEATPPLNPKVMKKVAENVKIPLATGERLYTRWGFRPFLEDQIIAVAQPDLCLAGGISETKKIADYANIYDVQIQAHVCGGPVSTAAALHLEAVIPNFIIHEHVVAATQEGMVALVEQDLQPKNSYFDVPDAPGLGVTLNEKVVNKYEKVVVK
ncbi:MAG TPA: mandelate racemase/muconate lactonizing enzyme family protein [Syntrophorhabdales bacterium]|nr:mandelate racemase/muconate lactonizing enzyme family protein [Syntrophorhabdales bacterium]